MKTIKQYIADQKAQIRLQKKSQIKNEFKIVERDEFLWLTHCGVAFMKIDSSANVGDVAKMLNEARDCAVEFERL